MYVNKIKVMATLSLAHRFFEIAVKGRSTRGCATILGYFLIGKYPGGKRNVFQTCWGTTTSGGLKQTLI